MGAALALSKVSIPKAHAVETKRLDMAGKVHILGCNEMTSTHGYWDNSIKPVLHMKSGEIVHGETGTHLTSKMVPGATIDDWMRWYKEVIAATSETYFYPDEKTAAKKKKKGAGHHHLTGPIYIEEAKPGDMLQIEILDIEPNAYGFNLNPTTSFMKLGVLADDFPQGKVRWYAVNQKKMTYEFLPGIEIPVKPFPGTIGVELPEKGMWSNVPIKNLKNEINEFDDFAESWASYKIDVKKFKASYPERYEFLKNLKKIHISRKIISYKA